MPTTVDIPELGTVEFPDSMSEQDISSEVGKLTSQRAAPSLSRYAPEQIHQTPDEFGIGEEVRGIYRGLKRGGRRFVQAGDIGRLGAVQDYQKQIDEAQKNLDAFLAQSDPRARQSRWALDQVSKIAQLKGEQEEFKLQSPEFSASFAKQQTAIEQLKPTRAQEEFEKPETSPLSFFRNPVELAAITTTESLPNMALAMAGAPVGPAGVALMSGAGSFGAESAGRITSAMQQDGVDLKDPKAVMAWFADTAKSDPQIAKARLAALGPAAFDALTGGLAGQFLKRALGKGVKKVAQATAAEIAMQMAGGGVGSITGSKLAGEPVDWKDVILEVAGELGPGEAVSNVVAERGRRARVAQPSVDRGLSRFAPVKEDPNVTDREPSSMEVSAGQPAQSVPPDAAGTSREIPQPAAAIPQEATARPRILTLERTRELAALVKAQAPLPAAELDEFSLAIPPGYVRDGNQFVFTPPTPATTETGIADELNQLRAVANPTAEQQTRIDQIEAQDKGKVQRAAWEAQMKADLDARKAASANALKETGAAAVPQTDVSGEQPAAVKPAETKPAVAEMVKVYRGDGAPYTKEKLASLPEHIRNYAGEWFTTNESDAKNYASTLGGKVRSFAIPKSELEKYRIAQTEEFRIPKSIQEQYSNNPTVTPIPATRVKPARITSEDSAKVESVREAENKGRIAIVMNDGTAYVGELAHALLFNKVLELGLAKENDLISGSSGYVRPDGIAWDGQGKPLNVTRIVTTKQKSPPATPVAETVRQENLRKQALAEVERQKGASAGDGEKAATIEKIVAAARRPVPEVVERFSIKGTDGKWYSGGGMPWGVSSTGERKSIGFSILTSEGTTVGTLEPTRQAVLDRVAKAYDANAEDFRKQLTGMDDAQLKSQADFWIKQAASPPAPLAATPEPKNLKAEWRRQLKAKQAVRYKTASDEKAIERLKAKIANDPSKWSVGDGVGYRVNSGRGTQVNRGFRVVDVDLDAETVTVRQVADTGLTSSGGNADRIGDAVIDMVDLVRDNKYTRKQPTPAAAPAQKPTAPASDVAPKQSETKPITIDAALNLSAQRKAEGKSQLSVAREVSEAGLSDADATGIAAQVFKDAVQKPAITPEMSTNEKEQILGDRVRQRILDAPSFQKLLAAVKAFRKSLHGQASPEWLAERMKEPWDFLSEHAGVMISKSARAKTLQSLADAVIREAQLPMRKPGKYRGMEYRIDWDKLNEQQPARSVVPAQTPETPTDLFPDLKGKAPTLERVRNAIVEAEADLQTKFESASDENIRSDNPIHAEVDLAQKRVDRLRELGRRLEQTAISNVEREPKPAASPVAPVEERSRDELIRTERAAAITALEEQLKDIKRRRKEVRAEFKGVKPISPMNRTTPKIERGQQFQSALNALDIEDGDVGRQWAKLKKEQSEEATPEANIAERAIAGIEDLQKKLRGSGADVSMGVPKAILDLALEVARLSLKAGNTIYQAIDAAIAKIREQLGETQFDESQVRASLNRELAPGQPTGDARAREEEVRGSVIDPATGKWVEAAEGGNEEVQVNSITFEVRGVDRMSPEEKAAGVARAQDYFTQLGLPGTPDFSKGTQRGSIDTNAVFTIKADGQLHDDIGERILQHLTSEIQQLHQPTGSPGYVAALVNAITKNYSFGNLNGVFSKEMTDRLLPVPVQVRSFAGAFLRALTGIPLTMANVARNADWHLRRLYEDMFGGDLVRKLMDKIALNFREEIERLYNENPILQELFLKVVSRLKVKPSLRDVIAEIFATRIDRQDGIVEKFVNTMVNKFSATPSEAERLKAEFSRTFEASFRAAREKAQAKALAALTPEERKVVGAQTPLWRKLTDLVNSGWFDSTKAVEEYARSKGMKVPTEAELKQMRNWSIKEQSLREPTAEEVKKYGDKAWIMAEGATLESRQDLLRKMNTQWSRWTHPLASLRHPSSLLDPVRRYNSAMAANEWLTANLLLKLGFGSRQIIDVGTQMVLHTPTRAAQYAFEQWSNDRSAGRDASLIDALSTSITDAYRTRLKVLGDTLASFKRTLVGRGEQKNVEQLISSIAVFDRALLKADEMKAQGRPAAARFLQLLALTLRFGRQFAAAADVIQGVPAEAQEMAHQIRTGLREQGKPKFQQDFEFNTILGLLTTARAESLSEARQILEARGLETSNSAVQRAAWQILREKIYSMAKNAGLPADEWKAQNHYYRNVIGWNEPETQGLGAIGGPGGAVALTAKIGKELFSRAGIPAFPFVFGNAMGVSLNRKLAYTPLGLFPGFFKGSPWFEGERNIRQRKIEAVIGTTTGSILFTLAALGIWVVLPRKWPDDEKEKAKWTANGWQPGMLIVPVSDTQEMKIGTRVGPMSLLSPYLAAGGAFHDATTQRAKKQEELNERAAKLGLTPEKLEGLDAGQWLNVIGSAAYASAVGGRTASGMLGSYTDFGTFSAKKSGASATSTLVPGLPGFQEISRMAGANINPKLASFWDLLVPLPTSDANRVNLLGDPMRNENDVERIFQILSGGTAPLPANSDQFKKNKAYTNLFASDFRPPSINPVRGYQFGNELRPMSEPELQRYTVARGRNFAAELAGVDVTGLSPKEAKAVVQGAFQRANAAALNEVGASSPKAAGASAERAGAASLPAAAIGSVAPRISAGPRRTGLARLAASRVGRRSRIARPRFASLRGLGRPTRRRRSIVGRLGRVRRPRGLSMRGLRRPRMPRPRRLRRRLTV